MTKAATIASALRHGASLVAMTAALAAAGAAMAEDAPPPATTDTEVEAVLITGFRGSLDRALDVKRTEAAATDSILAEDIGKFPDLNLSESIQRVPGVALARDGGEGRQISVRGLGPQFTRVRINGMEALTTVGSADSSGGTNRGRSFDFNVFASDLFNAITVRKTAEAVTEEGSLGATVDLRTARPFDYKGFAMAASALGSYNDLSEKVSPRGAFMISNTWKDGTFGALASVAYTKRRLVEEGASTVRWATGSAASPGFESAPDLAAANAAYHPRFPRIDHFETEQERLGATLALQWRPSDRTSLNLDVLYADFKGTRSEQYLEAPSFSAAGACTATTRPTTCGIADTEVVSGVIRDNTLVSGVFNDVDLAVENRFDKLRTTFTQFTLSGEHAFSDNFKIDGQIGTSKSDHDNPVQTTIRLDQFNVDGYSYDFTSRMPTFGYGDANLADPAAWRLTQIRLRPQTAVNTYDDAQLNATWRINDTFTVKAGVTGKRYEFKTSEMRRSNGTTSNQEATIPASVAGVPLSSYSKVIDIGGTRFVVPDLDKASQAIGLYDPSVFRLGPEPSLGNNKGVKEKDLGGYVQLDFATSLMDMPFRGNVGVRQVRTKQESSGYTFVGGVLTPLTVERQYDNTLPSMNLVLEPREDFLIRFGAAKVMARPDLLSLSPGATISIAGANRGVTAGNPNLDPFQAKTYDLAFEWYFQRGALLGLALFKKDIDSFVTSVQSTGVFSGNPFGLPDSVATAACGATPNCSPTLNNWQFTYSANGPGGTLKGFEVNYQQPLTFLPSFLKNTGVLLNYTYVKSDVQYLNSAGVPQARADLTGLSRNGYNATLYYEDAKFSARVSAAYRDRYLTRVPGQEAGTLYDGTNETLNIDASLQYSLSDKIKLTLEGVNLTDEYADQFNDVANRVTVYHHTGREILMGVRYTF